MSGVLRSTRSRIVAGLVVAGLVVVAVLAGVWVLKRHGEDGQGLSVAQDEPDDAFPKPRAGTDAKPAGAPFVTAVSKDRRYFVDQYGKPLLIRGDSPWALMTRVTPDQAGTWFTDRQRYGFNAAIVSLIGATGNGGPDDDGSTVDGLLPFSDNDFLKWNEPYWKRVDAYVKLAEEHGITLMLYPIDGWNIGHAISPESTSQCRQYGSMLAQRYKDAPNIVWVSGGDYFPKTGDLAAGSDVDHCIEQTVRGLRGGGDNHLFSVQLGYNKSITNDNPFWAKRVDWNFVYSYYPTYRAVLQAYGRKPVMPAIMGEANYEGENNQEGPDTTDETLRRQVLWSLTSGAAGDVFGSDDWEFHKGWAGRLDTTAVAQVSRLRELFASLPWWRLVPDTKNTLVTSGRGTEVTSDEQLDVLDSDYATAARTRDGRYGVVYLPTVRTITIGRETVAADTQAVWVDPASGKITDAGTGNRLTPPGKNSAGDGDWLLLIRPGAAGP